MSTATRATGATGPRGRRGAEDSRLLRAGGVAALILVIGYLATFPVYAAVGAQPAGVEARLQYFAAHSAGWWAITGLMILTDLLYVPVWLALLRAIPGTGRSAMLLAVAANALFVGLDLAVTWTSYASLITLGGAYDAAVGETARSAVVAAAGYPSAVLDSPLVAIYAILVPSLGGLAAGVGALRGGLGRTTAWVALAVGASGVVAVAARYIAPALGFATIVNAVLATVFYLLAARKLLRADPRAGPHVVA